ncbi:MAG: UDP-3-O-(3-hydroxymyristoyl)glucosamine N-acyltransferase [Schleiferiaceae bacterium]|nr:UDP-3-O-(3-hydroxymyristoyl)glucosamine N-acyltransferase [Schleiferiaceae bacterium]MDR9442314.1 UDP-3-O-(3-hydroxymyristoyl)glucosamine N-acyltransferase [Schleiferiaceae bacterium]
MEFSAQQIADMLGARIEGDPQVKVHHLSKIEEGKEGTLSFLANPQYTRYLYDTEASIVIVNHDLELEKAVKPTLLRVEDAYAAFAQLLEAYNQNRHQKSGVHPHASVSESATMGADVYIGAGCVIDDHVTIGANTKIYPNTHVGEHSQIGDECLIYSGVQLYDQSVIGNKVTLHAGVVIGSDGFGFAPQGESYDKVAQIGNVIIEDGVEVGANTAIDRATLGSTIIRRGVKLDNLIQVAHNVEIGENTVIASQTGIAGSTKIGKNVMIGGQVGMVGHLTIGDNVKIAAQSGIGSDLPEGAIVQGSPAFPIGDFKKSYVYFRKLPQMAKDIDQLKNQA